MGPLPASIYWRRRIVVLVALTALLALVLWLVTRPSGDGKSGRGKAAQPAPAQSITPGADPTGPAITTRPGGSGGSGGSTATGGVSGSGGGEVSLTTGGTGTTGTAGTSGTSGTASGGGAGGTSGGSSTPPPVNTAEVMALPVCTASQVSLELAGSQDAYKAKDKPRLSLTVRNTSTGTCRVNLGRTASTVVVTLAESNERIWSSGDCPTERQDTWVQLGAGAGLTETFTWERGRSKPQCATPDTTPAPVGRYLVQATLNGPAGGPVAARTSIRLED
ncbi:hypothetical protein ASE03_19685 [Kitasatospora sp. Root187]|nr:hypothetical protein ASC99_05750 [Kitasatospora sp. Root107]KRB74689.1 hypothetical protein ASE03_19685 [Kitasatospora sp. Root187]